MKNQYRDRERAEEVRRKKWFLAATVLIILITIVIAASLSKMAVYNVQTDQAVQRIETEEQRDAEEIEKLIRDTEEAVKEKDKKKDVVQ